MFFFSDKYFFGERTFFFSKTIVNPLENISKKTPLNWDACHSFSNPKQAFIIKSNICYVFESRSI